MRGEHYTYDSADISGMGSSPHARGTPPRSLSEESACGIIPACAGNTNTTGADRRSARDHPRMRGEHFGEVWIGFLDGGIIPACAGNTLNVKENRSMVGDHPRMRGEHNAIGGYGVMQPGSSPHARGTPSFRTSARACIGIIPACAGNTRCRVFRGGARWDHPRMRGEHLLSGQAQGRAPGSSPHARGTPAVRRSESVPSGIIPACAGNTSLSLDRRRKRRDHPRMRGEHR